MVYIFTLVNREAKRGCSARSRNSSRVGPESVAILNSESLVCKLIDRRSSGGRTQARTSKNSMASRYTFIGGLCPAVERPCVRRVAHSGCIFKRIIPPGARFRFRANEFRHVNPPGGIARATQSSKVDSAIIHPRVKTFTVKAARSRRLKKGGRYNRDVSRDAYRACSAINHGGSENWVWKLIRDLTQSAT